MMHSNSKSEEPRAVYGAWDNPGVSIFATAAQEPLPNLLTNLVPLPNGDDCVSDKDACRMGFQSSVGASSLYRLIKVQVEEMAAERKIHMNPRQNQERTDADITMGLAKELDRQKVEASRCLQLHKNVERLRELGMEVARAHTALAVKNKILNNIKQTLEDRQRERAEALAEQRAVEREQREEKRRRIQKAAAFRSDLMTQISENRSKRQKDLKEAIEEGQRECQETKTKIEQERLQDAKNKAEQRKILLEALDQSAEMLKQTREAYALAQKNKPERGLLDALTPVTATYVSRTKKRRLDQIQARDINAARLGFQLSQIKHDLESRDQLITNLLIRESKAKQNALVEEQARNKMIKKQEIRDQLLSQRDEQKFFREKAIKDALILPKDPMCFGERQYRMQVAQHENTRKLDVQCYKDMANMVVEGKRRKIAEAQEACDIIKQLDDIQAKQDEFVAAERMKLLAKQPVEVLSALKKSALTEEELSTFNLKK
ncbi:structural maintenance of chromosomes protein 1A [Drosophila ficusphila]|uniref:structural maintenance of chromosomes protein 1A n=1 Tax=Drosophila ficusphila TaxID=30025 RepID=UPI0007E67D17|nr:structural maintenance of chromosomes protein 1A [Drosophila ficusphila]